MKYNIQYQYYDLGDVQSGQIVEVGLGYAANVRIMDHLNYDKFQEGKAHQYLGGYVTCSPYQITIPQDDHWYVVIDLGGNAGKIKSYVHVLPGHLPPATP